MTVKFAGAGGDSPMCPGPECPQLRRATPAKRAALASFVGSTIEFYDFYVYGTAAALVFPAVFFPHMGSTMAGIASLATFAAAFLSRPLGAVVFGHFGDRLGRKRSLLCTLLIMGASTVAVGLVPGAGAIGVTAPLILLVLRLLQGFALGGEWAGSALLSVEYAPSGKRGMYGMTTALGGGAGLILTSLVFLIVNTTVGENSATFLRWGWRIPFLFSAVLIVVALYVRLKVEETPVFAAAKADRAISAAPIVDVVRFERGHVVLAAGVVVGIFAFRYLAGTYLMGYASSHLGHSRNLVLLVGVLGGVTLMAISAISARLSDIFGRRRIMLWGFAFGLPWSFVLLPLLDTGKPLLFAVGIIGTYATSNSLSTVVTMLVFGAIGVMLKRMQVPAGPVVLGLLLGPLAEENLARLLRDGTLRTEGDAIVPA